MEADFSKSPKPAGRAGGKTKRFPSMNKNKGKREKAMKQEGYLAGVDLGATTIKAGILNEKLELIGKARTLTPAGKGGEALTAALWQTVLLACRQAGVSEKLLTSVGVGCPGSVDQKSGRLLHACNLSLIDDDFSGRLEGLCQRPVYLENDGNCALLGEWKKGAAAGFSQAVMLTLGTGIGGGILVDGKLYRGFNGFGGEVGHMVVQADGPLCSCGRRGCFEVYASASGLIRMTRQAMKEDRDSLMWKLCGGDLLKADGTTPFLGLQQKDEAARRTVTLFLKYLAVGVTNIINLFQPEALVIGGGVGRQGEALLGPLRRLVAEQVYSRYGGAQTNILSSALGDDAGIIGAGLLGKENGSYEMSVL